jgi:hypothetical protein
MHRFCNGISSAVSNVIRPRNPVRWKTMALTLTQKPLAEVSAGLSRKTPIGSKLGTAEWATMPGYLRDSAFFSAKVESVRALADAQRGLQQILDQARAAHGGLAMDRGKWIAQMQQLAGQLGLRNANPDKRGGLEDFGSERRLKLIAQQQIAQAQNRAYYLSGQDPDVLDAWPAQELVRVAARKVPRDWTRRWAAAGGKFFGGRMIALKTDPIWTRISRFGKPYPPFDFNSGMGLEEIDREEAESLGLIKPGEKIEPSVQREQDEARASVKGLDGEQTAALLKSLRADFGDQVALDGDLIQWRGSLIKDLVASAKRDKAFKDSVSLGQASEQTVAKAADVTDLSGYELGLTADEVRHAIARHGAGNEQRGDQAGLDALDFELLPEVWRAPDSVEPGNKPGTLVFRKDFGGDLVAVTWRMAPKKKSVYVQTLYKKKNDGGAS